MAHFFKQAGFNFGVAHCNFNLRGAEAQRDEDFVKQLADDFKVAFYVKGFETQAFASQHKISTQMAARNLRYQWFEELRQQENYQFIALAQHQNDAVETVLLNLVRGTGISGLHGILPKRAKLIRPLMFLTAAQVNNLVLQNNVNFVEDSSNQSNKYLRNKLRLQVIPILQEINPNLNQTFEQNISRFAATEMVLQQVVAQLRNEICTVNGEAAFFNLDKIKQLNPQQLLLFELLKPFLYL